MHKLLPKRTHPCVFQHMFRFTGILRGSDQAGSGSVMLRNWSKLHFLAGTLGIETAAFNRSFLNALTYVSMPNVCVICSTRMQIILPLQVVSHERRCRVWDAVPNPLFRYFNVNHMRSAVLRSAQNRKCCPICAGKEDKRLRHIYFLIKK